MLRRLGLPRRAQQVVETLIRAMPGAEPLRHEWATTLLAGGPTGDALDPILGICRRPIGDPATARAIVRCDAPDPAAERIFARSLQLEHESAEAEASWQRIVDGADATAADWYGFGRTRAEAAARRGGLTDDDARVHQHRLQRALTLDPDHHHARYHLCRVSIRRGDWETAVRAADPNGHHTRELIELLTGGAKPATVASAIGLPSVEADGWTTDLLLTLFWWFRHHRASTEAFDVKADMARQVLSRPPDELRSHIDRVRAHVHLLDRDAALWEATRLTRHGIDNATATKIQSDVALFFGDPALHRGRRAEAGNVLRSVIDGRDVTVVGPVADHSPSDGLVIRTKWLGADSDALHDAPAVSYYPENVAVSESEQLIGLLDRGELELAVLRPGSLATAPTPLLDHQHVRLSPDELSVHLEASSFAIQRILYDVLACAPRSVRVRGADFLLSGPPPATYRRDAEARRERGMTDAIAGYGHDVLSDLRLSRNLRDAGLVEFSEIGDRALTLDDNSYLGAIDGTRIVTEDHETP